MFTIFAVLFLLAVAAVGLYFTGVFGWTRGYSFAKLEADSKARVASFEQAVKAKTDPAPQPPAANKPSA